jgi:hypothetical protein
VAAFVDKGMESLVAGEPSPQFTARLRARIAEEQPAPRFAWLTWKPAAAGLVMAAIVAAALVVLVPHHTALRPKSLRPGSIVASTAAPGTNAHAVPATNPAGRNHSHSTAVRRHSGTALIAQQQRGIRGTHSPAEPEVLVPPGQIQAVMQLAADIRSGRIDGKQLVAEQAKEQAEMQKPIEIPAIEIKPIEISPVDSAPEATAGPSVEPGPH